MRQACGQVRETSSPQVTPRATCAGEQEGLLRQKRQATVTAGSPTRERGEQRDEGYATSRARTSRSMRAPSSRRTTFKRGATCLSIPTFRNLRRSHPTELNSQGGRQRPCDAEEARGHSGCDVPQKGLGPCVKGREVPGCQCRSAEVECRVTAGVGEWGRALSSYERVVSEPTQKTEAPGDVHCSVPHSTLQRPPLDHLPVRGCPPTPPGALPRVRSFGLLGRGERPHPRPGVSGVPPCAGLAAPAAPVSSFLSDKCWKAHITNAWRRKENPCGLHRGQELCGRSDQAEKVRWTENAGLPD